MTYVVKNKKLEESGEWMINPQMLEAVKESLPLFREFYQHEGREDPKVAAISALMEEKVKEVFAFPFLSDEYVAMLNDEIEHMKNSGLFAVNDEEDELRQIPEFILQVHAPGVHMALLSAVHAVIAPAVFQAWHRSVNDGYIQIANYSPKGKVKGAWHHDHSSEVTVVVPLNTGEYKGGGTEFAGRGVVEPLPNGHALMFPAFTHLHRGLAVEEGDRHLLVFWLHENTGDE